MPRKKKVAAQVETPSVAVAPQPAGRFDIAGPEVRDGFVHLARVDLLEFELRQSRLLQLQNQRKLMRYEFEEIRRQQDRALAVTESQYRAAEADYVEYKNALGIAYNVDFGAVAYDDSTGQLKIDGAPLLAPE